MCTERKTKHNPAQFQCEEGTYCTQLANESTTQGAFLPPFVVAVKLQVRKNCQQEKKYEHRFQQHEPGLSNEGVLCVEEKQKGASFVKGHVLASLLVSILMGSRGRSWL